MSQTHIEQYIIKYRKRPNDYIQMTKATLLMNLVLLALHASNKHVGARTVMVVRGYCWTGFSKATASSAVLYTHNLPSR